MEGGSESHECFADKQICFPSYHVAEQSDDIELQGTKEESSNEEL